MHRPALQLQGRHLVAAASADAPAWRDALAAITSLSDDGKPAATKAELAWQLKLDGAGRVHTLEPLEMSTSALLRKQQVIPAGIADEFKVSQIENKAIKTLQLLDLLLKKTERGGIQFTIQRECGNAILITEKVSVETHASWCNAATNLEGLA